MEAETPMCCSAPRRTCAGVERKLDAQRPPRTHHPPLVSDHSFSQSSAIPAAAGIIVVRAVRRKQSPPPSVANPMRERPGPTCRGSIAAAQTTA
jgi:hypothetical protein